MIKIDDFLIVIPARGGSKGIPDKNIKPLLGKPLIYYSIDIARSITSDSNICVSTDSEMIADIVYKYGLKIPFIRPKKLAEDNSSTNDVLIHAIDFFEKCQRNYKAIILLQPTSPLRKAEQVQEALDLYSSCLDMVVSVRKSHSASTLCLENNEKYLESCFNSSHNYRQAFKNYYEYNGAIYIINIESLKSKGLYGFKKNKKYLMDDLTSIDIDNEIDWLFVETILKNKFI